jgi:hypothetical protein
VLVEDLHLGRERLHRPHNGICQPSASFVELDDGKPGIDYRCRTAAAARGESSEQPAARL